MITVIRSSHKLFYQVNKYLLQVSVGVNGNGSTGTLVGVAGYPVAAAAPSVPYGLPGIPYPLGYNYISGLTTSVSCINPQVPMQVRISRTNVMYCISTGSVESVFLYFFISLFILFSISQIVGTSRLYGG